MDFTSTWWAILSVTHLSTERRRFCTLSTLLTSTLVAYTFALGDSFEMAALASPRRGSSISEMTTCIPLRAKYFAAARPMPEAPPVMMARLPDLMARWADIVNRFVPCVLDGGVKKESVVVVSQLIQYLGSPASWPTSSSQRCVLLPKSGGLGDQPGSGRNGAQTSSASSFSSLGWLFPPTGSREAGPVPRIHCFEWAINRFCAPKDPAEHPSGTH